MLDLICMGSIEMFGTCRERNIQNENMSPAGVEPTPRLSTTGKSALYTSGIQIKVNFYVATRVKLIVVTCAFKLAVRLMLHFLSKCRF